MEKQKRVIADIFSLLLLTISVVSFIPTIINLKDFFNNTNYIIYTILILFASFSIFFIGKNLPQSQNWQKGISLASLSLCFLFCIATLFFFRNDNANANYGLYCKIKTFLPYFFVLSEFYLLNSIKDDDRRFEMMVYLSGFYYIFAFLSLDVDGAIIVSLAGLIYSFLKIKKHFVKVLIFILSSAFILFVVLLSINTWSEYLFTNKAEIFKNRNADEIVINQSFLPTDYKYKGDNYLASLANSFGILGLIISSLVFAFLCALAISANVAIEYWVFMIVMYLLSFVSIIFKVLNFEFFLFSPSLPTIALNALTFGIMSNKNI